MNKVQIVGRLTRDPEIRYSTGEKATATARFSIAVNRRFKNQDGGYDADFINCVAFGKTGEFVEKYFKKGGLIGICGRIQTGNYTNKDGIKVYTTDVVVDECEFVGGKNDGDSGNHLTSRQESSNAASAGFMNIPDDVEDEGLPFN